MERPVNCSIASESGSYAVVLTRGGCSVTSDCYAAGVTSVTEISDAKEDVVRIYPNPFSNTATIELLEQTNENIRFILYDAMGREVKAYRLSGNNTVLQREELINGVYFYSIIGEGEGVAPISKGKVVIY